MDCLVYNETHIYVVLLDRDGVGVVSRDAKGANLKLAYTPK